MGMPSAHELLAARAARIRMIRHRVVAGTVAAFALAWGVVAFNGSMGETTATAQTTTESTDATTSTDDETYSTDDDTTATEETYESEDSDDSSTLSTGQS